MASLTGTDAEVIVREILERLQKLNALDVIAGIDESLRLGIEVPVHETVGRERVQLDVLVRPQLARRRADPEPGIGIRSRVERPREKRSRSRRRCTARGRRSGGRR